MMTEVEVGTGLCGLLPVATCAADEIVAEVSMAKVVDHRLYRRKKISSQCLQLHGGYGFMMEYPWRRTMRMLRHRFMRALNENRRRVILSRVGWGLETRK